MKRYKVIITLSSGNEVNANVMARNQADAIRRLEENQELIDFIGNDEIERVQVIPIEIQPIDNERFAVTNVTNKPGWYVVADLDHLIKVEFKKGKFNETQKIHPIGEGKEMDALESATAMREIAEYLITNFKELV